MEAGLFFSAEAELTGEAVSAVMLLLEGWNDGNDADDDDDDVECDDVWVTGRVAALG